MRYNDTGTQTEDSEGSDQTADARMAEAETKGKGHGSRPGTGAPVVIGGRQVKARNAQHDTVKQKTPMAQCLHHSWKMQQHLMDQLWAATLPNTDNDWHY